MNLGRIGIGAAAVVGGMLGLGWLGLQIAPAPFPVYTGRIEKPEMVALPPGLQPPVERYFQVTMGDQLPTIESAVITGRGQLTFGGITFPTRLRFTHVAGKDYRHYIETTWLGRPVLRVDEWYLDGRLRMELPFGVVENEPKVDMAANLGLWGESVWLPSILATDPRVRWEPIYALTARLVVPFGGTEDSFTVGFDDQTGLIHSTEALRYRDAADADKTPWRLEVLGWETFHGVRVPSPVAVSWGEDPPWLVMRVEEVVYNADVSEYIRASGP